MDEELTHWHAIGACVLFSFSAASEAGLVSFFDFIVGANEQMLLGSGEGLEEGEEYDDVDFPALLKENIGQTVELRESSSNSQQPLNLRVLTFVCMNCSFSLFLTVCTFVVLALLTLLAYSGVEYQGARKATGTAHPTG